MLTKGRELVVVDSETTYNIEYGGTPGWGSMTPEFHQSVSKQGGEAFRHLYNNDPIFRAKIKESSKLGHLKRTELLKDPAWNLNALRGIQSTESIEKRNKILRDNEHQKGDKNSQFGSVWVNKDGKNKKAQPEELELLYQEGFVRGRVNVSPVGTRLLIKDGKVVRVGPDKLEEKFIEGYSLFAKIHHSS